MEAVLPLCRDAVMVLPGIMGGELIDVERGGVLWGPQPEGVRAFLDLRRLHLTNEERAAEPTAG
jgi:hypothetical protein